MKIEIDGVRCLACEADPLVSQIEQATLDRIAEESRQYDLTVDAWETMARLLKENKDLFDHAKITEASQKAYVIMAKAMGTYGNPEVAK